MKIAIRADASQQIGTGHIMRCMTLAEELSSRGSLVYFICREFPGHAKEIINLKGFEVRTLPYDPVKNKSFSEDDVAHAEWLGSCWQNDAQETKEAIQLDDLDWLIVDHYGIDEKWHRKLRDNVKKIFVIDDLADRKLDCDVLLDQNLSKDLENRYQYLVPDRCDKLLGPHYALLRPEFKKARKTVAKRMHGVKDIIVFFGGVDATDETSKLLQVLEKMDLKNIVINVIVGSANTKRLYISEFCEKLINFNYFEQISNISEMFSKADLSLGASGVATWERCSLMLPAIVVAVAFNQEAIAEAASDAGIIEYLGSSYNVTDADWECAILNLIEDDQKLFNISDACSVLIDCNGVKRVVDKILGN